MARPKLTRVVAALPAFVPFVGPEAQERRAGCQFRARLGANESVFGASPRAIAAMEAAARDSWMYSDPDNFDLRHAIAKHHNIAASHVVVGEGIDGLLGLTVKMFAEPGDVVVTSDGAYPTFNYHAAGQGVALVKVPFCNDKEDLQGLATAAPTHQASIVYVSTPNNPMGTWWTASDIVKFRAALPEQTLLFLDEAYCDTAPKIAIRTIDAACTNIIRYRTFSKAYGLAGARVGYAIADKETIAGFEKVRNHYGVNRVGQVGALAALLDQPYLQNVVQQISEARDALTDIAKRHNLMTIPSAANFVAIDCGGGSAKAERVLAGLLEAGVFVRRPSVAPQDRCIRVSCGRSQDLAIFKRALSTVLSSL